MALTPQEIAAARAKLGIQVQDPVVSNRNAILDKAFAPPEQFKADGALGALQDVAHGAVKKGTESILGLGHLGQGIQRVVGHGLDAVTGDKYNFAGDADQGVFNPATPEGTKIRQDIQPQNTAEQIGGGIEQLAEFAGPGAAASKTEGVIDAATKGVPGILGAGARILGKSAVQGAAAGATTLVDTGGDAKKALETAALAGSTRGGLAIIGEGANALHFPEKLYTGIFKNTKRDMLNELSDDALAAWQKNNPSEFKRLADAGIIKVGTNGQIGLNKTLAEEALDRGLKGSIQTMANEVVRGQKLSEEAARSIAAAHPTPISLPEKQYVSVLNDIATDYQNVGFGEMADEANVLASKLELSEGNISATDALALRRFFDRMRLTTSFDKPVSKLSMTQQNFKTLADAIRGKINAIPGMESVMKDYAFYIDALDALAQEAKRTGNNQVLSLIDSILLSGGSAAMNPVAGGAAALTRRVMGMPGVKTGAAQAIKQGVMGPGTSTLLGAGANAVQSSIPPQ